MLVNSFVPTFYGYGKEVVILFFDDINLAVMATHLDSVLVDY